MWWRRAGAPRERLPGHLALTGAALATLCCAGLRRPQAASVCAAAWLSGTAVLALSRIMPGPRTPDEVVTMALTSAAIPPAATWHWLRGQVVHRATPPLVAYEGGAPPDARRRRRLLERAHP
jgi:hypothetical protein